MTRSPLRITLGGGGTDLPSYYQQHEGFLIAAAIDKYVYIAIMRSFEQGIVLKHAEIERVLQAKDIAHPIFREALSLSGLATSQIEITALADIPAGTGLGSSASFTTALLKGLYTFHRQSITPSELAELACHIEIDKLKEPVGKQDQYIAAYGGLTCFTFHQDNQVTVEPLRVSATTLKHLEEHLMLFFTGFKRLASDILKEQNHRSQHNDPSMIQHLHYVKTLGYQSKIALEAGDVLRFGELMHEHWNHKKQRSVNMTNSTIDEWYDLAIKNGAVGGKLVGAGGGGFFMFYTTDREKLCKAMNHAGLEEVSFRFDFSGTSVVF